MANIMQEIRDLRDSGATLYIRNNNKSIVSMEDSSGRLELGPKGSDTAILELPDSKLALSGLQRMAAKGDVSIGRYEDFAEEWKEASADKEDFVAPLADFQVTVESDKSRKDLVEKKCLITGKPVFQSLEEVNNDKPPLHETVKDQESSFVVQHTPKPDGGHETSWIKTVIG